MKMAGKGGRTRVGFLAAWAVLMVSVAGVSAGAVSSREAGLAAAATPARPTSARPEYVPGEIIVKLRNSQPGQIQALSQDTIVQGHQATLHRLQAQYGVDAPMKDCGWNKASGANPQSAVREPKSSCFPSTC
jgi:membrane-bound lytic murein transglycosylase B